MRKDGLVASDPAPDDRRRCMLTPTPEGLRQMEAVRRARADALTELLDGWHPSALRTLGEMFAEFNRAVAEQFPARPKRCPEEMTRRPDRGRAYAAPARSWPGSQSWIVSRSARPMRP